MRTLLAAALTLTLAGCATAPRSPMESAPSPAVAAAPGPDAMTITWLYWGNVMESWTLPRGGDAVWTNREGETRTFVLSAADFDAVREQFRPYEGREFRCQRAVTDQPYGRLVWIRDGVESAPLNWDLGCVTGDASDLFGRIEKAEALLIARRDAE